MANVPPRSSALKVLAAGCLVLAGAFSWPLVAMAVGAQTFSLLPEIAAVGMAMALFGIAQLVTGVHAFAAAGSVSAWRKGLVWSALLVGPLGGLFLERSFEVWLRERGYSVVRKEESGYQRVDGPVQAPTAAGRRPLEPSNDEQLAATIMGVLEEAGVAVPPPSAVAQPRGRDAGP